MLIEAVVCVSAFYVFLVHTFTAKNSFVNPLLFLDRNFSVGMLFIFIVGITYLASLALMTPYLQTRRPIRHLFLFIGAEPNMDWLSGSDVALDAKGFVLTGGDAASDRRPMETSRRGVFAIGDVRPGLVKRVAAAVGEGAQVVATLHAFMSAV